MLGVGILRDWQVTPVSQRTTSRFAVVVSEDAMRVTLTTYHLSGSIKIEAAELQKELAAQNITVDDGLKARIEAICAQRLSPGQEVTLLEGVPPTPPQPPRAQVMEELANARPAIVRAGQPVAIILPAQPGKPGRNVFGQPCPAATPPDVTTLIDANVGLSDDGKALVAQMDGVLHVRGHGGVRVSPMERVEFDLYTPVPMECNGDLVVGQNVKEGTAVQCTGGSLYVGGNLETSAVADDIVVGGAIRSGPIVLGAGKTITLRAAGDLSADRLDHVTVLARGDVRVKDITHSTVTCGGRLIAPQGDIHASTLLVTGNIECRSIGSEDHTRSVIEIGADPELRRLISELLPQIEQRREHVAKVLRIIHPLLNDAKRLTREQKERCTELLYDSETTEAEANAMLRRLTERYGRLQAIAGRVLTVHEMIHPGVTIRFAGVETTLRMGLRGPLVIRATTERMTPAIVCRYQKSSQDIPLETRPLPDDPLLTLRQYLNHEARRLKVA